MKGRTFYAVYTSETSVESEAQSAAAVMKAAGGSGYIYNDGTYKIVAAVYPDASSADTVAERLTGEGMQAARLELEVPRSGSIFRTRRCARGWERRCTIRTANCTTGCTI